MRPYVDYDKWFIKSLKDPIEAAAYLNAALDENDPAFFLSACYDVARARGIKIIADKAKLHRVSLNKMFSKRGNPEWRSLFRVLTATKLRFRVEPAPRSSSRA